VIVALWDVAIGARMLLSPEPWLAHGRDTVWGNVAALGAVPGVKAAFQRIGAFSLHAGGSTLVFAAIGARYRPLLTAILFTYAITGLGFFLNDTTYFQGTPYFYVKQAFGALWVAAIAAHLYGARDKAEVASRTASN
jgi:hypothetical protein